MPKTLREIKPKKRTVYLTVHRPYYATRFLRQKQKWTSERKLIDLWMAH